MTDRSCAAALTAFGEAIATHDWAGLRELLADDFTTTMLHTGEVLDAETFVSFTSSYPGNWIYTASEIVDGNGRAALRSKTVIDGQTWHAAVFASADASGRITDMVEIWTEPVGPHSDR